jgi:exosortase A
MPPEAALQLHREASLPLAWRAPLAMLALAWAALIALFLPQWTAMADQWWNISTYTHILVVPAILAWLVAQRWPALAPLAPGGWWPGLILFAGAALLWVLGGFAGLALAQQAGAVLMLIMAVPALLGPRVAWGLLFPLFYMLFLVPFGDELIPAMQTLDARLTVALLHVTGVPTHAGGVFLWTPAGLFEIAEACSGVKFLVAMVAFGILAANVCFVSPWRRAGFIAASVIVPILANAVRSWGTVYVAQIKGAAWAGGFDHIVYGWIFFAIVIGGTIAAAWRYFDRGLDAPMIDGAALAGSTLLARLERLRLPPLAALLLPLGLAGAAIGWERAGEGLTAPLPARIALPEIAGWHRLDTPPRLVWEPRADGAGRRLLGRYADGRGHVVDVFVALYAATHQDAKPDGLGEGATPAGDGWTWAAAGTPVEGARSERLLGRAAAVRVAETSYRNGALLTGSPLALRLSGIADRLLLRPQVTSMLILSAEDARAEDSLAAFRAAIGPRGEWIDAIGKGI